MRRVLEWGAVLAWARDNKVPDTALVTDQDGPYVTGAHRGWAVIVLETAHDGTPVSWGQLRQAVMALPGITEAMPVHFPDTSIRDLGHWGEEPGEDYLIFQRRWG